MTARTVPPIIYWSKTVLSFNRCWCGFCHALCLSLISEMRKLNSESDLAKATRLKIGRAKSKIKAYTPQHFIVDRPARPASSLHADSTHSSWPPALSPCQEPHTRKHTLRQKPALISGSSTK